MPSGEGDENGEKTTIVIFSQKNNFARAAHFFCTSLCRCFARPQRQTTTTFLTRRFI